VIEDVYSFELFNFTSPVVKSDFPIAHPLPISADLLHSPLSAVNFIKTVPMSALRTLDCPFAAA
jgi:hypothetical protein